MPTYKVRLDDPGSDEFRIYAIVADSQEDAVAKVLHREQKKVDYRLTTDEMKALEDGTADVPAATAKARLLTHHQATPYEVTSVEDYSGGFWKAAREARAAKTRKEG